MTSTALVAGERVDTETGEVLPAVRDNRPTALLRPIAPPADVIAVQNETRAFIAAALKQGRDYGIIPGVAKKSLFQPGAERVCTGYGVYPTFRIIEQEIDHVREIPWRKVKAKYEWANGKKGKRIGEDVTDGVSLGLYRFVVECTLIERASGNTVCTAIASASTLEAKYIDRPREAENTVLQMAEKRAYVRATRTAFGLSEEFTQDVEDNPELADAEAREPDAATEPAEPEARCPICKGPMWDNREGKKNPKAPDFKCRDRGCDGVYWPGEWPPEPQAPTRAKAPASAAPEDVVLPLPGSPHEGRRLGAIDSKALAGYADYCAKKITERRAAKKPTGDYERLHDAILRVQVARGAQNAETPRPASEEPARPEFQTVTQRIRALLTEPACQDIAERIEQQLAGGMTPHQLAQTKMMLEERIQQYRPPVEAPTADEQEDTNDLPF